MVRAEDESMTADEVLGRLKRLERDVADIKRATETLRKIGIALLVLFVGLPVLMMVLSMVRVMFLW